MSPLRLINLNSRKKETAVGLAVNVLINVTLGSGKTSVILLLRAPPCSELLPAPLAPLPEGLANF